MLPIWIFLKSINPKIWLYIVILAALSFTAYRGYSYAFYRGVSHQKEVDSQSIQALQRQIALDRDLYAQSLKDSSKQTLDWQAKTDKANEDANNAKQKLETIAANNARLVASLRNTTNKASERIKLPDTTKDAADQYAITASIILNDCVSKYSELGKIADSHVIDEQKLIDSYPKD